MDVAGMRDATRIPKVWDKTEKIAPSHVNLSIA